MASKLPTLESLRSHLKRNMVMVKNKHGDELQNVIIHADTIVDFVIIQHGKVCSFRYETYKVSQIPAMPWEIYLIATIKDDFVDER